MKAIVIAIGSYGDVHPLVGIAATLKARGHNVLFATNGHFESLAKGEGLEFAELGSAEEYHIAINDPDLWDAHKAAEKVAEWAIGGLLRPVYELIEKHRVPGQTIVVAAALGLGARLAQEKLNLPTITTQLQPVVFLSLDDPPVLPMVPRWSPRFYMRFIYWLAARVIMGRHVMPKLNAFRKELGLAPVAKDALYTYWNSPQRVLALFPEWFAAPAPDWPKQVRQTGFPLYDEKGVNAFPPDVEAFLKEGAAPIAFTPGSAMLQGRPFFEAAAEACRILGKRGMLLTRYAENIPPSLPPGVKHFPFVPFSELLPRVAALVHHGGIGTTAQALAAGTPQLIMPMAHDQPDNAARVEKLGVGLTISRKKFRGPQVAARLKQLIDDPKYKSRAQSVAKLFVDARALEKAVEEIEALARDTGVLQARASSSARM